MCGEGGYVSVEVGWDYAEGEGMPEDEGSSGEEGVRGDAEGWGGRVQR